MARILIVNADSVYSMSLGFDLTSRNHSVEMVSVAVAVQVSESISRDSPVPSAGLPYSWECGSEVGTNPGVDPPL